MITKEEKDMLKASLDLTINSITNSIMKIKEEDKPQVRAFLRKHLDLLDKIDSIKEEKK
jgi:spore coat protein CotF